MKHRSETHQRVQIDRGVAFTELRHFLIQRIQQNHLVLSGRQNYDYYSIPNSIVQLLVWSNNNTHLLNTEHYSARVSWIELNTFIVIVFLCIQRK